MNENEKINLEIEEDPTKKYLDQIQEMKRTHVSREQYDKIRDENKMLLDTIVQGRSLENSSTEEPAKRSIEEIANHIYGPGHEKLKDNELISDLFELRNRIKEEHGIDIAIPNGQKYQFDVNDLAAADRVEEGFKHCLEVSEGDNKIFMREAVRLNRGQW